MFNQRLALSVQHSPTEAATEAADPRESNPGDFDGFTFEHCHAGSRYTPAHLHHICAADQEPSAGYKTELTFPHWLAKATYQGDILDLIFRAGNGLCEVDDSWFDSARDDELLGVPVKLCAPEEMIWMKAYIMERERFDGADIAHILLCCAAEIDWPHLVRRFGPDWRVLLSHLILFCYIYPGERTRIPDTIMAYLITRLRGEAKLPGRNDYAAARCFAAAIFGGLTGVGISRRSFRRACSDG